ncbi:hypothetical protein ACFHW2_33295 [Actinomadura sp. LOL_016]|uniref:hypothetical protein n=1 Tax=unclassified Actinomadura TaxID=2626254 RepID=UPI003A8087FF
MSGYGPSGWDGAPHGSSQGWDPNGAYGQSYGYGPAPGYGPDPGYGSGPQYGPPGVPHRPASQTSAIIALVCNSLSVVSCCNVLAIPGIITGALAIQRVDRQPESARSLTMWSWIIFGVSTVLAIAVIALLIAADVGSDPDPYPYSDEGI